MLHDAIVSPPANTIIIIADITSNNYRRKYHQYLPPKIPVTIIAENTNNTSRRKYKITTTAALGNNYRRSLYN